MQATESNNVSSFLENISIIKHFFEWRSSAAFLFAVSDSFYVRKQVNESVVDYCKDKGKVIGIVELEPSFERGFLSQLRQAKEKYPGGMILNNHDPLISASDGAFAADFNLMREGLIELKVPLLIWLDEQNHTLFTRKAFDLYLRRDMSTVFFEDPVIVNTPGAIERFTEKTRTSPNFEETHVRVTLLKQQLREGREDDISRHRLANEVALPLIQAYVDNSMLIEAKGLLSEFEGDFDYNKTDADSIIAGLFEKTGDYDRAISHYERSLNKDIQSHGEEHATIADDYNHLGTVSQSKGNLINAVEYFEKALNIDVKLFGEENSKVAIRYNNLGGVLLVQGYFDKAIEYFKKALNIDIQLFGEKNSEVAIRYNNLGMAWKNKGNLDKSIEYIEKALKIDLDFFGEGNPNVAIRYSNLGCVWQEKGNVDKAIEYFEKALKINLEFFGEAHQSVAIRYNNLGLAWRDKGNWGKAIEYFEKALKIGLELFGEENPNVATCYNNLGLGWQDKGNLFFAVENLEKAYSIFLKLYGEDNPSTQIAKQNYEDCLEKKNTI